MSDWIKVEPTSGEPGTTELKVTIEPNIKTSVRKGSIIINTAGGKSKEVTITQAASDIDLTGVAGRWWDETNATPTAAGYYGDLQALRDLPQKLGLGRYLVTDDRVMRKLDPTNSRLFTDGTPAALDGSMGQCMWCWSRAWYFTEWKEGNRTIWAITLTPIKGHNSYRIPIGGVSWLGAGVMDRTEQKLCSLISEDERYRGGNGSAVNVSNITKAPAAEAPQVSMLGMVASSISTTNFGNYARKRGEGWESNWFVAATAVEILLAVIMGTRNIQAPYNPEKDANGLYQGGFGTGVTDMPDWIQYNNNFPIIPTRVGLEMGDGTGLVDYALPASVSAENQETPYKTFKVPVFFGLVHANFGHLWRWVRGLLISQEAGVKTEVFVARSMFAAFDPTTTEGLKKVAECPQKEGYIKRVSTNGLCMMPTEVGGSASTYYPDHFYTNGASQTGLRARAAGGGAHYDAGAGAFCTSALSAATNMYANCSSPLCFFKEDPVISDKPSTIVLDSMPNIEWMPENLTGNGGTEYNGNTYYTWREAINAAETVGEGWRLPTKEEFATLQNIESTMIKDSEPYKWVAEEKLILQLLGFFDDWGNRRDGMGLYWSKTGAGTNEAGRSMAYVGAINYYDIDLNYVPDRLVLSDMDKNSKLTVRLVRDIQ